jgi:carboxyl-terminal processing protease
VGYLRIFEFSKSTAEDVAAQLKELRAAGMKSLILDVRNCPGGLLDASIEVTDLFLPAGRRIMTTADRDGNEKHFDTQDDGPFEELPIVAVVGPYTASGAEILTSALQHHGRARVIGTRTMGKGTVESIHELDNGWALKLSISRFSSAAGEPMLGRGVTPDIEIPMSDKPRRGPIGDVNAAADPQLSAALALSKD